jgi:hypothetical protein
VLVDIALGRLLFRDDCGIFEVLTASRLGKCSWSERHFTPGRQELILE